METEGSVYRRLNRLLWRNEPRDEPNESQSWVASTGERMILASGPNSWAASCVAHSEVTADLLRRITYKLVDKTRVNSGDFELIRNTLLDALKVDLMGVPESNRNEKIARIGFPLHLRLLLDSQDGGTWEQVGCEVAAQWALPPVAVPSWFWHQMFSSEPIHRHAVVSTRTIATTQLGGYGPVAGVGGTLSVGQIDWPNDIDPPESHFVPHHESFGFCLDHDFIESLKSSHCYLSEKLNFSEELKLWPADVVLEWNLSMDQPDSVPVLSGGSAGAALTLAAGSLLARRHLRSSVSK